MRLLPSLFLIAISFNLFSQELIVKKTKTKDRVEEYHVLKSNKNLKHGQYKKYKRDGELLMEGDFSANEKSGRWTYYRNGDVDQIYDHTSGKIMLINNEIEDIRLDQPPMFIGGKVGLNEIIGKYISYPEEAWDMGVLAGRVLAAAVIDENNNLIDVQIVRPLPEPEKAAINGVSEFERAVVKGLREIKNDWISGNLNGNAIKSRCILEITFFVHYSGAKEIRVE